MTNQKKFGIWMDNHHAVVVGSAEGNDDSLAVIAHIHGEKTTQNSSENTAFNQEKTVQGKFFKEISTHLTNATHIHVTGTGTAQEQFIHYLADTPQFKNSQTSESTSIKMNDEKLIQFISSKF
ncbi:MAG: hypothetical protein IPP71_02635 [Bacteroidetes bacterium]|nr:hypothetical protein [Bacteroidota bacterium]